MNDVIYKTIVLTILVLIVIGGVMDLGLYLAGHPTISAWLRENPRWFLVPAWGMLLFLLVLTAHLFFWR